MSKTNISVDGLVICPNCKGKGHLGEKSSVHSFPLIGCWPCGNCNSTGKVKNLDASLLANIKYK